MEQHTSRDTSGSVPEILLSLPQWRITQDTSGCVGECVHADCVYGVSSA